MNIKKVCSNSLIILLLALSAPTKCTAPEDEAFISDSSTNEYAILFDDFNADTNDFLNSTHFNVIKAPTPDIIIDIIKMVGGLDLLQQDFYLHTYVLNRRNILDLPTFLQDLHYRHNTWLIGIQLFYDEVAQANFTSKNSHIESYIALNHDNIIGAFGQFLDKIKPLLPDFEFPFIDLFDLMGKAKVQERRAGFMITGAKQLHHSRFVFWLPFMYDELNFFLTEDEKAAIDSLVGQSSPEEEDDVAKHHLISDKLGFGDFRFAFEFPVLCRTDFELDIAAQVTLPTSFALAKGMLGSSFKNKNTGQPTISFIELFDLGTNPNTRAEAIDKATEFFLGALDRLSAILLDRGLGNEGHLGVAMYVNTRTPLSFFIRRPWAENILLKGKILLEYLFPKIQQRYFIEKNNSAEFDQRNFCDPNQAAENLAFLEQTFVNKFYPYVIDATVHPGFVFWWTSKATYENNYFAFHLGTDTWVRTPESIHNICASPGLLARLDTQKAKGIWAYQSSIVATAALKIHRPTQDLIIGLNFYSTMMTRGIGEEYSFALTIENNF